MSHELGFMQGKAKLLISEGALQIFGIQKSKTGLE